MRGEVTVPPDDPFAVAPLELPPSRQVRNAPGSRTRTRSDNQTGRYVRATPTRPATPDLALDATLRAAAPYQTVRDRATWPWPSDPDLRHKVRERKIGRHILLAVDASGSMGAQERMRETKAAILSLLLDAYQRRERVGLVVFQGEQAVAALPFTHSIEIAQRYLRDLPTGGKTPLPHGLALSVDLIKKERAKYPKDAFLLVLITDGKANISLTGKVPMTEVKELAVQVKTLGINSLILNTERYWHEASCLPEISQMMGASYYTIDKLKARDLVSSHRRGGAGGLMKGGRNIFRGRAGDLKKPGGFAQVSSPVLAQAEARGYSSPIKMKAGDTKARKASVFTGLILSRVWGGVGAAPLSPLPQIHPP
jgi:magnesium chelatase subunit D